MNANEKACIMLMECKIYLHIYIPILYICGVCIKYKRQMAKRREKKNRITTQSMKHTTNTKKKLYSCISAEWMWTERQQKTIGNELFGIYFVLSMCYLFHTASHLITCWCISLVFECFFFSFFLFSWVLVVLLIFFSFYEA